MQVVDLTELIHYAVHDLANITYEYVHSARGSKAKILPRQTM